MLSDIHKMERHQQIVFAIVIAFAVVSFWRGAWGLMDQYLLPSRPELSLWMSLFLGLGILLYTHYTTKELV